MVRLFMRDIEGDCFVILAMTIVGIVEVRIEKD